MSFFNSNKVKKVFPSVNRSDEYVSNSRIISESLLTGLVNNLIDKKNFVVSYDSVNPSIQFNLEGYYFDVDLTGFGNNSLFVRLLYKENTSYKSLDGDDASNNNSIYKGLEYTTEPDNEGEWFQLLEKSEDVDSPIPTVPKKSYLKYSSTKIDGLVEEIDGGEI